MVTKLSDMQHSMLMLEVAKIVSEHNEHGIGSFSRPHDDDFIDFAVELECNMIDISALMRYEREAED